MKQAQKISDAEMEVMRAIWKAGEPVTSGQVQEALADKGWKTTTVCTFLARLTAKGLLKTEKAGRGYRYAPQMTEKEYRELETREFLKEVHGGSLKSFFAVLSGGEELTADDIQELKDWLKDQ